MKRIYHPYWLWEDYKNGMYELNSNNEVELIEKSVNLLSNLTLFKEVALEVISKWIVSAKVNLTNPNCNKKAWLGQASCNYKYNVPEYLTRIAWSKLSDKQRINADNVAIEVIKIFNKENEKQYNQLCIFMED
jgi:hypothetical protein